MTEVDDVASAAEILADIFSAYETGIVAFTGAGISTESGVPDFRSPGGLWSQMQPIEYSEFLASEESRMIDWKRRFEMKRLFDEARPNAAHDYLARLAQKGAMRNLITQNVDGLHQRSGVSDDVLVELHGNSTYATCLDCDERAELDACLADVDQGVSPRCKRCSGLLKAAVVSFGQQMPEEAMAKSVTAAEHARLFIVIGSSLVVHPAAQLPVLAARSGAEFVLLNREETPLDRFAEVIIRAPISKTFDFLASQFGQNG
ncbi:MAG: NAD-dependent deacetylase [Rhodobacteraceae bacterium]|nr:NAD-dependent deacetylase [Paracoccaceae bacterium]